jgi:glutaredoxin
MTKNAIVWTKTNSPDSATAVKLVKQLGYTVDERNISSHYPWDNAALKAAIPDAKTVPQIVLNDVLVGGLKELRATDEFKSAAAAKIAARAAQISAARAPKAPKATPQAEEAAKAAALSDRLQAHKTNTLAAPDSTKESRYAAKQARVQESLTRYAAEQAPRITTPQGYEIGTSKLDSPEQHQARYEADKTARAAARTAAAPAIADREAARAAATKARIQAATAARIASLAH